MVRRSTWIVLSIFAVLLGLTWLYQRHKINNANKSTATFPTAIISYGFVYDIADNLVNEVEISASSGEKIKFMLDSEFGIWSIFNLPNDQVDSSLIEYRLENLFSLKAEETLKQTPPLEAIGLASPAYVIMIHTLNGGEFITDVGSKIPTGNGYYIRVNSGPIRVIDESTMDEVLELLIDPAILASPTPEFPAVESALPTPVGFQTTPSP